MTENAVDSSSGNGLMHNLIERTASTGLGQLFLKQADRLLWTTEKCAQWAMPQTKVEDDAGKLGYRPELVRPLPWVLFLPTLLALRAMRVGLSLVLLLLGKHPLQPATMVRFIQDKRRRLRAIKFHGLRGLRMQRHAESRTNLLRNLSGLLTSTLCFRQTIDEPEPAVVENLKQDKAKKDGVPTSDKRKFREIDNSSGSDDLSDEEQVESLLDMVDRLAAISDVDDPDYTVDSELTEDLSEDDDDVESESENSKTESRIKPQTKSDLREIPPALPTRNAEIVQQNQNADHQKPHSEETTNGTGGGSSTEEAPPLAPKKQQEEKPRPKAATPKIAQNGTSAYKEDYRPYRLPTASPQDKDSSNSLIEADQRNAHTLSVDPEDQFYSPASSSCASPEPNEISKLKAGQQNVLEPDQSELPSQDSGV